MYYIGVSGVQTANPGAIDRRTTAPGDRPTEILLAIIYLSIALFLWFIFSPQKKQK
jgi:hypothetical protein